MADFTTEYDRLLSNKNARVIVSFSNVITEKVSANQSSGSKTKTYRVTPNTVVGFIQGDFNTNGANDFNNPLHSQAQEDATRFLQVAQGAAGSFLGKIGLDIGEKPLSLKTFSDTVHAWTGSQRPSFTVPMAFVAVRNTINVIDEVNKLYRTVYPVSGEGSGLTRTVKPPLQYLFRPSTSANDVSGTMVIQIGKWFRATNQLMRNVNFTYSKEVISTGKPLYAIGSITFEPYRMISIDEFRDYFID